MSSDKSLASFLDFLLCQPSTSEICEHTVLVSLAGLGVWANVIIVNDETNRLITIGQYGLGSSALEKVKNFPLSSRHDILSSLAHNTVVTNMAHLNPATAQVNSRLNGELGPLLLLPLLTRNRLLGIFAVFLLDDEHANGIIDHLRTIQSALTIALLSINKVPDERRDQELPLSNLTSRQISILECLELGDTNGAIARKFGYSESTIRQETMRIYRFFQVNDRRTAVEAAKSQGLL